jgi:hypothetical protein
MEQLNSGPGSYQNSGSHPGLQPRGISSDMNPVGATSDTVVPNKSRMREEEIEVPYARDSVLDPGRPPSRSRSRASRDSQMSAGTSVSARQAPVPPNAHPPTRPNASAINATLSPTMTDDREYYDRMSFSSNVTGKSKMVNGGGWDEEREQKIRQEYEFRVAGLERKMGIADTEKEELRRVVESERERRSEWEEEVRGLKEVSLRLIATH